MKRLLTVFFIAFFLIVSANADFGFNVKPEEESTRILRQDSQKGHLETLNVLVWNVYKGSREMIAQELKEIKNQYFFQVGLFQEAQSPRTDELCLVQTYCVFSEAFYTSENSFGVMTTSQADLSYAFTLHSDGREPILKTPKTTLITTLKYRHKDVLLINTHGINFVDLFKYRNQLREVVNAVKEFSGPIIWAGDFNTWNPGRVRLLKGATKALGLKPVEFKNKDLIKSFLRFPLDHVFIRGLTTTYAEVLEKEGSDHNPLILGLELEEDEEI